MVRPTNQPTDRHWVTRLDLETIFETKIVSSWSRDHFETKMLHYQEWETEIINYIGDDFYCHGRISNKKLGLKVLKYVFLGWNAKIWAHWMLHVTELNWRYYKGVCWGNLRQMEKKKWTFLTFLWFGGRERRGNLPDPLCMGGRQGRLCGEGSSRGEISWVRRFFDVDMAFNYKEWSLSWSPFTEMAPHWRVVNFSN